MTILDACVTVLKEAQTPLSAEEIYSRIGEKELYSFGAKDPLSILRATIRKHLKSPGAQRLSESAPKRYSAI